MFEKMVARAEAVARDRVRARIAGLAERLRGELPPGVGAEAGPEGVVLSGQALRRRMAFDPYLGWSIGEAVDG